MPIEEAQQQQSQQTTDQPPTTTPTPATTTTTTPAKTQNPQNEDGDEDDDDEDEEEEDDDNETTTDRTAEPTVATSSGAGAGTGSYYEEDEEDEEHPAAAGGATTLRQLFAPNVGGGGATGEGQQPQQQQQQQQSEDEEDGDYIPDEEVKKTIMVGSDFQAQIPEGLCRYDDALPYENEDKLLWNPTVLGEDNIEEYLVKIAAGAAANTGTPQTTSVYSIPLGRHLRDDEQGLYLLQQCGHNIDEALRRKRINAVPVAEQQMSIWSEEECRNFENGLRIHGKDFHMIQQSKVRTRSVGELVQFYYLWKKTERHDLFASKARLEKKKYNLHPGLTDHMDRFLEEQENSTGFGDRSSSPGFNSLYAGGGGSEAKRARLMDSKEHSTGSSKRSSSAL